jgi:nicotinamide-nucleotide adenylyltransferase
MKEKESTRIGVVIARFQPLHYGHMHLIEKALKECERVVVVVSSADKSGTKRNPLGISTRVGMVSDEVNSMQMRDVLRTSVLPLQDWSDESDNSNHEWGNFLYYNILRAAGKSISATGDRIAIYYSDNPEIIKEWFSTRLLEAKVEIRATSRATVLDGLSATEVRKAIAVGDKKFVRRFCPKSVIARFDDISIDIRRSELKGD